MKATLERLCQNEKEYLPYGKEKAGRAIWEVLKRMYKEAEPSADLEKNSKKRRREYEKLLLCIFIILRKRRGDT